MPTYVLKFKADLENISCMTPLPGNKWEFDVRSPTGEERMSVLFSDDDEVELEGNRGLVANYAMKWSGSTEQAYIRIVRTLDYNEQHSGEFAPILVLECNGVEPIAWHPSCDFNVRARNAKKPIAVNLSDKDWSDYDEEHKMAMSIINVQYMIE